MIISAVAFFISLALGCYLLWKSDATEMRGEKTKSMLLFEAFLILLIVALAACLETKPISEMAHIDYTVVDNIGSGLISGSVVAIVLISILVVLRRKPAPAK